MDTGQGVEGGMDNEALEVVADMGDGQGERLPRPLKEKKSNRFEIIRLS